MVSILIMDMGFTATLIFMGEAFGTAMDIPLTILIEINRFNNNRRNDIRRNRAYSSSYRGQAAGAGVGRTAVNTRAQNNNSGAYASLTNENSRSGRQSDSAGTTTVQTQQGRTANVRQSQNLDDTENRVRRTQNNRETQNRSQIDRVMRQMQANGFDVQVINTPERARRYQQQNQSRNVVNLGRQSNRQVISRNNNNNSTKENSSSRSYSNTLQQVKVQVLEAVVPVLTEHLPGFRLELFAQAAVDVL